MRCFRRLRRLIDRVLFAVMGGDERHFHQPEPGNAKSP